MCSVLGSLAALLLGPLFLLSQRRMRRSGLSGFHACVLGALCAPVVRLVGGSVCPLLFSLSFSFFSLNKLYLNFFSIKNTFFKKIYLFIFGCAWSSLLPAGFL